MTRETKAGLLMILMLGGVFGFMVYKRLQNPAAAMAQQTIPDDASTENDLTPPAKDPADPFQKDEFDRERDRVVTAGATKPARIPEDEFAGTESRSVKQTESGKGSFAQFQSTNRSKPNLPTSLDDELEKELKAKPKEEAKHHPVRVAETAPKANEDPFDAFSGDNTAPAEMVAEAAKTAPTVDSDPFDTPSIEVPAKSDARFADVPVEAEPKSVARKIEAIEVAKELDSGDPFGDPTLGAKTESNDGFEAPVALKEAPREMERQRESDPFAGNDDLEVQVPPKSAPKREEFTIPNTKRREEFREEKKAEIVEFQDRGFGNSRQLSSPNEFDSLDAEAAKTSVPALTIPSRDTKPVREPLPVHQAPPREAAKLANDDRFGGFVPATVKDPTANAFEGHRAAAPVASNTPVERRVTRPAPAAQIDEDFRATATRPLVAGDTYEIEPGDNFWTISRKKYGTGRYFMALAQHNSQVIPDPKRMKLGVSIATPAAEVLERTYAQFIPKSAPIDPVQTASIAPAVAKSVERTVTVASAQEDAESGFFISEDGAPMYRIGREDTLSGVAQRHLGRSSRWTQIFELNRDVLPDGNSLKIGAVLRLPADASRVDVVERGRTFR